MAEDTRNLNLSSTFDPSKLEAVEDLLRDVKQRAQNAQQDGDTYMLGVYNDILQVVSPIVVKAHARVEREAKAALNKAEREARKAERAAREAERKAREAEQAKRDEAAKNKTA